MHCPRCKYNDTKVSDSRLAEAGTCIRRRRICPQCKFRFTTFERMEQARVFVVKKDGRRELFDKEKILKGVLRACEKRPVSFLKAEDLVGRIEMMVRSGSDNEVPSGVIGAAVMEELRKLDEVAYVRFASVYKEFKDVSHFSEELKSLERARKRASRQEV